MSILVLPFRRLLFIHILLPELACRTSSFFFQFASAVALSADMTKETTQLTISNPPYSTTHPQKIPPSPPSLLHKLSFFHDLTSSPQSDSLPLYTTTTTANPPKESFTCHLQQHKPLLAHRWARLSFLGLYDEMVFSWREVGPTVEA